jgi:uncharacterized protein
MKWLAGPKGGGWYAMAEGLRRLLAEENPGLALEILPGGGKDNPGRLQDGDGQLAMSIDFLAAAAYRGQEPYPARPMTKLNTIGIGWSPLPFQLLRATTASPDLAAAIRAPQFRIAVPAKDTSDELTFQRVMAFYGTTYDAIKKRGGEILHGTYDEIVTHVKAGRVDYLFGATTKPAAIIASVGEGSRSIALTDMPDALMTHLTEVFGYGQGIIASSTYPMLQTTDVKTTFMETVFLISADGSEEIAYRLTKALLVNRSKLGAINPSMASFSPATAWRNTPVPLHPGAARAYKELGFMPQAEEGERRIN